jgi:EmrB/QacA subfamily drug resistance transporter
MEKNRFISYKWLVLLTISIGMFMATLDASIVNITYPRLTMVFETEPSVVLWVSVVYLLVSVALMLAMGKMGDSFGRKRIYILGFAIFTAGLVFCSVSQNIIQLILARAVQGIGAAMMLALSTAIITAVFPDKERGKAVGILGGVVSAGLLTGPVIGGFILDSLDWRAVFYVRIPIGIIGIITARIFLREQIESTTGFKFDLWGTLTLCSGLSCLLLFFNLGGRLGFISPLVLSLVGVALILLVFFVLLERRAAHPIIDLSLFRNRLFASGNISLGIMTFASSSFIFLMPFYLIVGLEYSASEAGLVLAVTSLTTLMIGPLSGWLSDKIGSIPLCTAGIAIVALALFLLRGLGIESTNSQIILRLFVLGLGIGMFGSPNTSSIMGSVPREKLSTGSAMISTTRQIGLSSGIAIFGTIFASRQLYHSGQFILDKIDPLSLEKLSLIGSFQDTIFIAAIICSIGFLTSLARSKKQLSGPS